MRNVLGSASVLRDTILCDAILRTRAGVIFLCGLAPRESDGVENRSLAVSSLVHGLRTCAP